MLIIGWHGGCTKPVKHYGEGRVIVKHVTSINSDICNIGNKVSQKEDWTSSLADLSPSGSNYAVSQQAIELFTALRSGNLRNAVVGASQLAEMSADRGLRSTYEAAKALEVALLCSDRCDAATVKSTCAELVAEMLRLRLVNNISTRRRESAQGSSTSDQLIP